MHGRLKVRTTAEEAIRKKKEQDLKAKAYRNGMDKILAMRQANLLDQNLLDLSAKILSVNPDLATLWNIRKECLLKMREKEDFDYAVFDRELPFTESCLQVQPKSYGAWHHRVWILSNSPNPDYEREVKLCTLYLKKDERNFHCWDYRRYVAAKANIPAEKEFEFCDEKIMKNFSNYSSWYYRSQLLPILHPHETDPTRPISEEKLKEELELVITAAFTDPNDSSAWFYQRWLLGYSDPKLDLAAVKVTKVQAIVAFTRPIELVRDGIEITIDGLPGLSAGNWISASGGLSDSIWIQRGDFQADGDAAITVKANEKTFKMSLRRLENGKVMGVKCPSFGYVFGAAVIDELKNQLDSCNQLLEYEPESKWTLLTASLLMRSIDRCKYHEQTLDFLRKLQKVDYLRAGYYKDLLSKWSIEMKLMNWIESEGYITEHVDLSHSDLALLYYQQYFAIASEINLHGNPNLIKSSTKAFQIEGCNVEF